MSSLIEGRTNGHLGIFWQRTDNYFQVPIGNAPFVGWQEQVVADEGFAIQYGLPLDWPAHRLPARGGIPAGEPLAQGFCYR